MTILHDEITDHELIEELKTQVSELMNENKRLSDFITDGKRECDRIRIAEEEADRVGELYANILQGDMERQRKIQFLADVTDAAEEIRIAMDGLAGSGHGKTEKL